MSSGAAGLDHGVVVLELDEVEHPPGDQVGDAFAHLVLGQHDVVGADAFEDPAVLAADGLGPDVGDAEVDQQGGGEDAGLDVGADADDGAGELVDAELAQGLGVGAVGDRRVGELVGVASGRARASVSMPRTSEPRRISSSAEGAPKRPEADHDDPAGSRGAVVSSQRWVAPRAVRSGGRARAGPAPRPG